LLVFNRFGNTFVCLTKWFTPNQRFGFSTYTDWAIWAYKQIIHVKRLKFVAWLYYAVVNYPIFGWPLTLG